VLNHWLDHDQKVREELTRLREFQTKDPFNEGTEFDYFIHSSGVQFILDETKKDMHCDRSGLPKKHPPRAWTLG